MKRIAPLLFPLLVVLFCVNTASSQSVQFESVVKNNFPRSLIFTLDVTAPVDIEDVTSVSYTHLTLPTICSV